MTPRERVLKALNHQEPDRVPFDLGGSAVTVSGWRARLSDAERVAVRLGPANDSVVVVESGLNEGDIVLVPEATANSSANAAFRFSVGGLFGGRQR